MTDYWLTKHYGGLVCDIQGWFRRGCPFVAISLLQ